MNDFVDRMEWTCKLDGIIERYCTKARNICLIIDYFHRIEFYRL